MILTMYIVYIKVKGHFRLQGHGPHGVAVSWHIGEGGGEWERHSIIVKASCQHVRFFMSSRLATLLYRILHSRVSRVTSAGPHIRPMCIVGAPQYHVQLPSPEATVIVKKIFYSPSKAFLVILCFIRTCFFTNAIKLTSKCPIGNGFSLLLEVGPQ